jgi:hypothetical protein
MGISDFLFGQPEKLEKLPTLSDEQMSLLNQLLGASGQGLGDYGELLRGYLSGSPESYQKFEAPLMRQFQQEIVPSIAERFTGIGGQRSNAFSQALGQAGGSLSEKLASLRGQLQMQSGQQLQGLLGLGLGAKPFGYRETPGTSGFLEPVLSGLGTAAGMYFGGPAGGALGGALGSGASSGLQKLMGR